MLSSRQRHCLRRWLWNRVAPVVIAPGPAAAEVVAVDDVVVVMLAPGQLPRRVSLVSSCF